MQTASHGFWYLSRSSILRGPRTCWGIVNNFIRRRRCPTCCCYRHCQQRGLLLGMIEVEPEAGPEVEAELGWIRCGGEMGDTQHHRYLWGTLNYWQWLGPRGARIRGFSSMFAQLTSA